MSASAPPPGYANPRSQGSKAIDAFAVLLALTLLLSLYELGLAEPHLYALGAFRAGSIWLVLIATGVGLLISLGVRSPANRVQCALALLSLLASGAGHAWMAAFPRGAWLHVVAILVPGLGGALVGISVGLSLRGFGRPLARSGAVLRFMRPLSLGLTGMAFLVALSLFPLLGVLGRAGLLGAALAGASALVPAFAERLGLDVASSGGPRWLTSMSALAALLSVGFLTERTPAEDIGQHAGEVVFVLDTERGHHVVSSIQGGLVLFSNGVLSLTHADNARFAEALVHPALVVSASRKKVLAFDDGTGSVEREILRWSGVERIVSVPRDPALHEVARRNLWLRAEGAEAFASGKVRVSAREPSTLLAATNQLYDVILADFGDPHSYVEAKYLTHYWFRTLRGRLTPGGVLAVQATSPLRTPRTFAAILATLEAAGFVVLSYRAPLPTLGEWGFALAADAEHQTLENLSAKLRSANPFPKGTAFVTAATLPGLFATPPLASKEPGAVSYLYDQPIVDAYQSEDRSFSGY